MYVDEYCRMVTIGPLFLFFVLGATFCLGRKNIRHVENDLAADDFSFCQRSTFSPSQKALPVHSSSGSHNSTNLESAISKKIPKTKQGNASDAKEVWVRFEADGRAEQTV